jgi:hypothetical protein
MFYLRGTAGFRMKKLVSPQRKVFNTLNENITFKLSFEQHSSQ